jgi:hypothetical protein
LIQALRNHANQIIPRRLPEFGLPGRIIAAFDTSSSMVYRVRKQLVEEGFWRF